MNCSSLFVLNFFSPFGSLETLDDMRIQDTIPAILPGWLKSLLRLSHGIIAVGM